MIIDFKTKQKLNRADQIARLNPEMTRDQIAQQLGIKPEIILIHLQRKASAMEWILFIITFAVIGALIGWGITL